MLRCYSYFKIRQDHNNNVQSILDEQTRLWPEQCRQAQIDHWMTGSSFSLQEENPPAMSVTAVKP